MSPCWAEASGDAYPRPKNIATSLDIPRIATDSFVYSATKWQSFSAASRLLLLDIIYLGCLQAESGQSNIGLEDGIKDMLLVIQTIRMHLQSEFVKSVDNANPEVTATLKPPSITAASTQPAATSASPSQASGSGSGQVSQQRHRMATPHPDLPDVGSPPMGSDGENRRAQPTISDGPTRPAQAPASSRTPRRFMAAVEVPTPASLGLSRPRAGASAGPSKDKGKAKAIVGKSSRSTQCFLVECL